MNEMKFFSKKTGALLVTAFSLMSMTACATSKVNDDALSKQRDNLKVNTQGKGFGPQSPRDIDSRKGKNDIAFAQAPEFKKMNLCNIHFHKNAEHKGGQFTAFAGHGDGKGHDSGYKYNGDLSPQELSPFDGEICKGEYGSVEVGDTLELHYVHSSAQIQPGPTLGACLSDSIKNPQLRVETQVYVVVNDDSAADFKKLTKIDKVKGYYQAPNIPSDTGAPVVYAGSTTGPSYNEAGSPFQVTWSVRPKVKKVTAASVASWCEKNVFNEDHAHGVRNLVINRDLLSVIEK